MSPESRVDEKFRLAIRSALASEDPEFLIANLLSVIEGNEALQRIADFELAPRGAELELHLDGDDVVKHATNAKAFGLFVLRIAESSKQYVKDQINANRLSADLLISPGVGSVRATFIAPDPATTEDGAFPDEGRAGPVWTHSNVQSESLHRIAVVFANADPEAPESEALDGAIQQLPPSSRRELRKALTEVVRREWSVSGEFRQRGIGVERVELRPAAAKYLSGRLQDDEAKPEEWRTTGVVDGHRWSTGLMYFRPVQGRAFHASFASSEVQEKVAVLAAVDGQQVEALFTVYVYHGPGVGDSGRRSYVLVDVKPLDAGPAESLEVDPD